MKCPALYGANTLPNQSRDLNDALDLMVARSSQPAVVSAHKKEIEQTSNTTK